LWYKAIGGVIMNPEQERQAQAQRVEDRMQELDKDLRFLSLQISKIEKMIRTALEQVKIVNLSAP
jgi:asparagine synthetase B (glutamine-hydrolysing)